MRTQQVFIPQCVWWLASVIGLEQGLVIYIDNVTTRLHNMVQELPRPIINNEDPNQIRKTVSPTHRDIQEDPRSGSK